MMKILVMSDTHRRLHKLPVAMKKAGKIDAVIHCGDIGDDKDLIACEVGAPLYVVAGNCDYDYSLQDEIRPVFAGVSFLVTHGHRYRVNYGTDLLERIALSEGVKVVCYGHTHVPDIHREEGLLVVNPGSLSEPRQSDRRPSCALIGIDDQGVPHAEIVYLS